MLKYLFLASMLVLSLAIGGVMLALGGCGGGKKNGSASAGAAAPAACREMGMRGGDAVEIGRDRAVIARLNEPVAANATVFHAESGVENDREVRLLPGTWLLPSEMLHLPGGAADKRDKEEKHGM